MIPTSAKTKSRPKAYLTIETPVVACPFQVNRVVLTTRRALPVYPEQTFLAAKFSIFNDIDVALTALASSTCGAHDYWKKGRAQPMQGRAHAQLLSFAMRSLLSSSSFGGVLGDLAS